MCTPTIPSPCTLADVEADPIGANSRLGTYTNFVNLLDLCAIAVPTGTRADGRPVGVTLIGRAGEDGRIAALAADLHRATTDRLGATGFPLEPSTPAHGRPPPGGSRSPSSAHISRACRSTASSSTSAPPSCARSPPPPTTASSRSPRPRRPSPGLLRCASGEGASIETEIWSLSAEGFGRFVALVPPPLSIGTLALADGTSAKGFLVEAEAVRDARDISAFGGWRAYLKSAAPPRAEAAA